MIKFSDLKMQVNNDVKQINYGNFKINVLQYLPIKDKNDLVQITMEKSEQNGIYNEIKKDMYFHLHLIYLYTDIEFTQEEKENPEQLYDKLLCNNIFDIILEAIPKQEYQYLQETLEERIKNNLQFKTTAAAVLQTIITDLPTQAAAAKEIIDSFDQEKYLNVKNFAEAANGNRPIQ